MHLNLSVKAFSLDIFPYLWDCGGEINPLTYQGAIPSGILNAGSRASHWALILSHSGDLHMNVRYYVCTVVVALLAAAGVRAQWTKDPSQNAPISVGNHAAQEVQMSPDGNGGAYFVWDDDRNHTEINQIFCQHCDANGNAMWTVGGLKVSTFPGGQVDPRIVSDSAGGAFICWNGSADTNTSREDVFAQHISSNGTLLWGATGIDVSQAGMFDILSTPYAKMVADGVGGFYIAWDENVGIYIGRVNVAGTVLWKKLVTPLSVTHACIIRSGDGGAIIAYNDARSVPFGDYGNVFTQKVDSSGTILWGAEGMPACNAAEQQDNPALVSDGSTGAIVAWEDFRNGTQYKVFAQHLNGSGGRTWVTGSDSGGVAVCTSTDTQFDPILSAGPDGSAVITWNDGRRDMYVQKLRSNGSLLWGTNGVQVTHLTIGIAEFGQILSDGSGGAFLVWSDTRNLGSTDDMFAQRLSSTGVPQWTDNGVVVSSAAHAQIGVVIIPDGKGNVIAAWDDERNTNSGYYRDLYAQKIGGSGTLLDVHATPSALPAAFSLSQNYPNPFNPTTSIQFSVQKSGQTSLIVYNVLGEEVGRLFEGIAEPGKQYSVTFNASENSSGVYYYRLSGVGLSEMKSMVLVK